MEIKISGSPEEIQKLLQAIMSSEEQLETDFFSKNDLSKFPPGTQLSRVRGISLQIDKNEVGYTNLTL